MWYKSEHSDSPFFSQYPPIFDISVGKNDPHIRVLAGFMRFRWGKLGGKNNLDLKDIGGQ
jgi:hypothetical protein